MKLTVHLFGALRLYLPTDSDFNSCELELLDNSTLTQLLKKLQIPGQSEFIILLNDQKISQDQFSNTVVDENDEVILLPSIKGG